MAGNGNAQHITDMQMDWLGGVNSNVVTTIASPENPDGLARNELAWLINAGIRDGGITQRAGWNFLARLSDSTGFYQGGDMYAPDFTDPYLLLSISGHILAVNFTPLGVADLSKTFGLFNPPTVPLAHFAQGEQFTVIQAGDYGLVPIPTNPLFWDGAKLVRSPGITNTAVPPGTPGVNGLPAAGPMIYYQNRMWYAQGRTYGAGDILKGNSGTAGYRFNDAILNVTENPLVIGGDNFAVPSSAGNVRALNFTAAIDTTLGQGPLYIFTRKQIYSLQVPISRSAWIATNKDNPPQQTVAQRTNGSTGDRCVVPVNGDLFYQSFEPAVRSLIAAIRYYAQWANTPVSANVDRLFSFNNRALLSFASGVEFDNRMFQTALPRSTPQGVVHDAIAVLDFQPVSNFRKSTAPVWEGSWEGLQVMQLFTGDFGGLPRMFAVALSKLDNSIQLWEFTSAQQFDVNASGQARATWQIEFPAYTCGKVDLLKQLETTKYWFDRVYGIVDVTVEFRPDSDPCWHYWHRFRLCQARNDVESGQPTYPVKQFCEGNDVPISLPRPPSNDCEDPNKRLITFGYQFQTRMTIKGFCRVRRQRMYCLPKDEATFYGLLPC